MPREDARTRSVRLLREGRVMVLRVGPVGVLAVVRGDSGELRRVEWSPRRGWACECPAIGRCAHGIAVASVDDLALGSDALPPTDGLRIMLSSGTRIIIRPSGTEPKVKCYLQCVREVDDAGLEAARAAADAELQAVTAEVGRWLE